MAKKLIKLGNSLGVVIDKPILELLKITPETQLELSTDGKSLTLTPVPPVRTVPLDEGMKIADEVMREHADVLRKLAK